MLGARRARPAPVPGFTDVWKPVRLLTSATGVPSRPSSLLLRGLARLRSLAHLAAARLRRTRPLRSPRRMIIAGIAFVLILGSSGAAYAQAHKTVTIDVDGTVTTLTTFAGSVDGVLRDRHVGLTPRDTVAPSTGSALRDGSEIVVRHAHQVQVSTDGVVSTVWTTALTAEEALQTFASRGSDIRLVASRSSAGRVPLSLTLKVAGQATVRVDGTSQVVDGGSRTIADILAGLGITLGDLDQVAVTHDDTGAVTVTVSRIVVADVSRVEAIAFATVTTQDPTRYTGQRVVRTAGVDGARTIVERVTTTDGVETSREPLSATVTAAPVDQVVAVGTKPRPVAAPTPVAVGGSASSLNWAALAMCESGGNPTSVSRNGLYYGLYQFSVGTWQAVGGSGLPSQASAAEQTARAQMLYARSGAGQWPVCGAKLSS
ncbi:resuscitation-promoting factor RpfB precursor [mine drainage metagenome]|uniref:Resuscitation-promoting factor RpfB n=1 Tax=mine drainage metagenome TaxID=410659 RepID=A0A1J5RW48_9ZZZZ